MTERINQIIKYYKVNATKFADEIGVQRSSISHVLSGRNKPSLDFIQKLLKTYPEVRSDWLILGKGSMIIGEDNLFAATEAKQSDFNNIPRAEKQVTENKQTEKNEIRSSRPTDHTTQMINAGKSASKIVFFYSDGSFKEYFPE